METMPYLLMKVAVAMIVIYKLLYLKDCLEFMESKTLRELLTESEISQVINFLQQDNLKMLRLFLNEDERKKNLEQKGVFSDYLYYLIVYSKIY